MRLAPAPRSPEPPEPHADDGAHKQTIRLCAEAQLDTLPKKSAVVVAVDALVRDKAAAVDIDSIDLYEWALQDAWLPSDYSKTIGALRARWAKANPSNPAVVDCLEACVREWDLVNAQQVSPFPSRA